jgi:hypothetical protein
MQVAKCLPSDWEAVTQAAAMQSHLLECVVDKQLEFAERQLLRHRGGVYVIFFPNGRVARIGRTIQVLASRLRDYEPNYYGWFEFRWIGVVRIDSENREEIKRFERYMIDHLDPPENVHHRRKRA